MNSYTDIDGVPVAGDRSLLTGLLRDEYGFTGTVVSDYFAVPFLETLHHVAADLGAAARIALVAGIDVELPTVHAYGDALVGQLESGEVDMALLERSGPASPCTEVRVRAARPRLVTRTPHYADRRWDPGRAAPPGPGTPVGREVDRPPLQ